MFFHYLYLFNGKQYNIDFIQMIDGKNGLVTDINPEAVNAIERIMEDKELYTSIEDYLKQEKKEIDESVKKFDQLIQELFS